MPTDFRPSAAVAPTTGASIGRRRARLHDHAPGRRRAAPSLRRRDSSLHDAHGRSAARAQKRRTGLHPGRAGFGGHFQHDLQQRDQALAVRLMGKSGVFIAFLCLVSLRLIHAIGNRTWKNSFNTFDSNRENKEMYISQ